MQFCCPVECCTVPAQIPVNCPYRAAPRNYQRDGPMCVAGNQAGAPNYFPNSFGGPGVDRRWKENP